MGRKNKGYTDLIEDWLFPHFPTGHNGFGDFHLAQVFLLKGDS